MNEVNIYRTPEVAILLAQSFLLGAVYQSMVYYIPLYFQNARQLSIMASAGIFASLAGIQAIMSTLSGVVITHHKKYGIVICFGFAMWTL